MALLDGFFQNTRKPEGLGGRMMLDIMNGGAHEKLATWALDQLAFAGDEQMLDLGCGGGANLARLLAKAPEGTATGADYSPASVEKSREVNAQAIAEGRCQVVEADVAELPFADDAYDLVTAFETIYFWPQMEKSLAEAWRVVKPGGRFALINEEDGLHEKTTEWSGRIDGMRVYTPDQLEQLLRGAGFSDVRIIETPDPSYNWIIFEARK